MNFEDWGTRLQQLYRKNLAIAFAALLVSFFLSFLVLRQLNQPLRDLEQAVGQVATGDLTARLPITSQDEVGKLTASFNTMAGKLVEQKQLEARLRLLEKKSILTEMVAGLAHEIRNPLNLINLTVDHFAAHENQPEKVQLLDNLKAEVRHLNQMVNNFIAYGQPARLNKMRFSLAGLLEDVQTLIKQELLEKKVSVEYEAPLGLELHADLEQFRLVLLNIFLNAVRAVPEPGRILVEARSARDGSPAVITIADNGPGVPEEHRASIFEPYFSRRPGGAGLGLALVKRIVEEHGGTITAGDRVSGGAVFTITLPQEG
jgi:signal transduction histidine kinase